MAAVFHRLLQLGDPGSDPPPECGSRVLGLEVRNLSLDASLQVRDLRGDLLEALGGGSGRLLDLGVGETAAPVRLTLGSEQRSRKEPHHGLVQGRLTEVHVRRVVGRDVGRALVGGLAAVVDGGSAMIPPHPKSADAAAQDPPVQVLVPGWCGALA
ncbi:MAG TPA: hypothetical protein VEQ37_09280 [Actinomycetota bacterium]|nr:hypothetical protein [Actinomycetota bacterium]